MWLRDRRRRGRSGVPPRESAPWGDRPSGTAFAATIEELFAATGQTAEVDVHTWTPPGLFGVSVGWDSADCLFEVADGVAEVRILNTGDVVTAGEALQYVADRVHIG